VKLAVVGDAPDLVHFFALAIETLLDGGRVDGGLAAKAHVQKAALRVKVLQCGRIRATAQPLQDPEFVPKKAPARLFLHVVLLAHNLAVEQHDLGRADASLERARHTHSQIARVRSLIRATPLCLGLHLPPKQRIDPLI
jgi:hypothetical protein